MQGYVGVTDNDWFNFLSQQLEIDEVNFWQPGGNGVFNAISAKELARDIVTMAAVFETSLIANRSLVK